MQQRHAAAHPAGQLQGNGKGVVRFGGEVGGNQQVFHEDKTRKGGLDRTLSGTRHNANIRFRFAAPNDRPEPKR
ncbi:hypothetical protein GCM10022408_25530 [Hymenobacter fastidiosus]|uniref:Uncharacterized protein n=1 Tax=Hymenobacter fastidiosus TaxID=486264 RepID=A0ABP7SHV3_9BACT